MHWSIEIDLAFWPAPQRKSPGSYF